jgi:hypothetical protein
MQTVEAVRHKEREKEREREREREREGEREICTVCMCEFER